MSLLKLAAMSFLVTMTLGNPMPVDSLRRDATPDEDPYAYYKKSNIYEKRDATPDEDPYAYYKKSNIYEKRDATPDEDPYAYYKKSNIYEK